MPSATATTLSIRDRVSAILEGRRPDRLPFLDRLEVWHKCHSRAGTLPQPYREMALAGIYRSVGMGQQKFMVPYGLRLNGVEVISWFDGEEFYHETDPVFEQFPGMWDVVDPTRPGVTITELRTAVGKLHVRHEVLPTTVAMGADPYMREHMIKEAVDYRTVEHILERAEFVPWYDRYQAAVEAVGDHGYVAPLLHRIPFQQVLLEYLGEVSLFYALHDDAARVQRLLELLDCQMLEILRRLADFPALYVEFPDNLHGQMTNPRLFARYCLPAYQRYSTELHAQGKKMGSHTDGDMRPILALLAQSGLDVCESFSPAPLTRCTFDEAWRAWEQGPMIWGGIPSPILEERTTEGEFREHVARLLATVGSRPIILGIGDLVLGNNLIERVQYIAEQVEGHALT